jgi:flap endonuclease-1
MGLNIKEIIPRKEIEISDLKGKLVCVDAFNALYQFLSTIKQPDGTPLMDEKQRVTSHLSGIFYRNISLMSSGIKIVYVFDGKAPELKSKVHLKRKELRDSSQEKYLQAKREENLSGMKKYSSSLIRLNEEMIGESKELLEAMGILTISAPSEGEAEAAYLCKTKKEVYAAVSQDYDSLLFGAKKLVRNLALSRRKKTFSGYSEVFPEVIDLEKVLSELEINQEQLICLGILVGTDYNPKGVPGIGQKRALQIVKDFLTPEKIFESVKEKMELLNEEESFDWKEIFELFVNHPVVDVEFVFPKADFEKIKQILVERHGFSLERVEKQLEKLEKVNSEKSQKNLGKWF